MLFHSLLNELRKKILRFFLGDNAYTLIALINKFGPWYFVQKYAPESKYPELLDDWFRSVTGNKLNLLHPRTYNEKVQWLKLYDNTPLKALLSDKFLVRRWVAEKIGEQYLIPLLGVWDDFDEINFDVLPDQFVLKVNHGSNWLIIVKDKAKFNKESAKQKINTWMNSNFAYCVGLELQYRDIKPKIIAEQYLEDESGYLADYKIYCFEGRPCFIRYAGRGRDKKGGVRHILYDLDWNPMGFRFTGNHRPCSFVRRPDNLAEMVHIADVLGSGFHHVRVDLYLTNGKIYFGEMTFTPASGLYHFDPDEWNLKLGDMIKLPTD
jgi:hypothetical protein